MHMALIARHYQTGQPIAVELAGGKISAIRSADSAVGDLPRLPWVAPGLIDIQINGFGGPDFDDPAMDRARWVAIVNMLLAHGVTTFFPTFCTNSRENFVAALGRYAQLLDDPVLAHVMPGVHIEGPYISDEDGPRGAHNRQYTRDPSMEEIDAFDRASGGRLRILTLAPERTGAIAVIRELARRGVLVAIGHSAATAEQLDAAVAAGARLSTHLGNGAHTLINRHRNYVYDQLADDRLWASIIPDGHHLPRALLNIMLRAKGLARVVFVSDASGPAGLPPGRYGNREVLPNGRMQVADRPEFLSGSTISLDTGVGRAVELAGLTLAQSIDLATIQPAKLMSLADRGRLEVGAAADLVLFDWDTSACKMKVRETIVLGKKMAGV
jgi:N-acetylglucosamine-6-phosphate deacetylase